MKPLCFVLMPFGEKPDGNGKLIDFDAVYEEIIAPSVDKADLDPIRADEEMVGGIIHKPMFERLMLCEYAVADVTTANPNVLYELGIRHALRPRSTLIIFASGTRLPFDVQPLRGIPYKLNETGKPSGAENDIDVISKRLESCREPTDDSPLYQLIDDMPRYEIDRAKTDVFREVVEYSKYFKNKLRKARAKGAEKVRDIEEELGDISNADPAVVVDLFLSYRAVKAWEQMVALADKMTPVLRVAVMVQEQLALALNRLGRGDEAEHVLLELIEKHGPSSETNGILGRVYKDKWEGAAESGSAALAEGYLLKAIQAYMAGFEADWRDAYPGVNAVTLMEMQDPVNARQGELLPVVRYAAIRRASISGTDYWDYATLLEVAVLTRDRSDAKKQLARALASIRESWEPETTARNLRLIREKRQGREEDQEWVREIEQELIQAATDDQGKC